MTTPPCQHCNAACCRQTPNHAFAVLLDDKELPNFPEAQQFKLDQNEMGWAIPYQNNACIHLKNDRCQIYDKRPQACKDFNCTQGYAIKNGRHGFFLEDHPHVVQLIELHVLQDKTPPKLS